MIHLQENKKIPLYIQLYEALKKKIIQEYKVGEKLPSIRKIASEYQMSKNTVESAYSQLYAEGYLQSKEKVGYFVSDDIEQMRDFSSRTSEALHVESKEVYLYDFYPARLTHNSFPLKVYKRMFIKAMQEDIDFGSYGDAQGERGLREQILRYLQTSRGVRGEASQLIVCGGFSDSMALLSEILKPNYTRLASENPGYPIMDATFVEHGFKVDKVAVDTQGLSLPALEKIRAKLLYITPSHQYPTGVTMPIAHRIYLLEWAKRVNGYIIEDDYDSELNYKTRPIPSLQGLDNDERVIYVGTFSKSLSPALRVSYMLLPTTLLAEYKKLFHSHFSRVSLPTQKALELFMREGHYERHLRKVRTLNRKKHDAMLLAIREIFKDDMKIIKEGGGLNILMRPSIDIDLQCLREEAKKVSIKLYLASDFYGDAYEAIRMGFGGLELDEIYDSIVLLKKVFEKVRG